MGYMKFPPLDNVFVIVQRVFVFGDLILHEALSLIIAIIIIIIIAIN